jgi:predicted flap endonuclease-1-like 5' DNA nuclease
MGIKRGITVWISAFVASLSIMYSFAMIIRLINEGAGAIVNPYIISDIVGGLNVETYLWMSVTATFIFLGITCIIAYRKQPPDPEIIKMFLKVGGNLATLRKAQEASITETASQMEYNRKVNQKIFSNIKLDLEETNKEIITLLAKQRGAVKKIRLDLVSTIEKKTAETGEKLSTDLRKQETAMIRLKRLNEESLAALNKQRAGLEEIELRLERIEGNMVPIQAKLKSLDNPENIKGIGPSLGKELTGLGITSVGDFLTTDPYVIGEKTRISQELAENLQAMAQLMMIPGLDANDAELLIDVGVSSRRELAGQDLIELSRKVSEITKIYVDQGKISKDECPTIEEVSSWIRMAR